MNRYVLGAIGLVALIAIGLAALWLTRGDPASDASQGADEPLAEEGPGSAGSGDPGPEMPADPDMAALLETAAEQINAEAPIRIDEITTLSRATTRGNRIRYRYDVAEAVSAERLAANRERMAETTRRDVCAVPADREIVAAGAEIEFAYYGPGGDHYFSTVVDRC